MTGRRRTGRRRAPGLAPVYEGPEVLTSLLRQAGSPHDSEAVAGIFSRAQAAGEPRSAVIPALFPEEPRFASPEEARRLYSNLFGLWARLSAGLGPHDDAPEVAGEPAPAPVSERGTSGGETLPADLVEAVWRHLAAASPRELQSRRDRFQSSQPDLTGWLEATPIPDSGALAALDIAFESWAMFDQAFGDRLGAVDFDELRALEKEPPPVEQTQPALAVYVAEQLDVVADEDPAFGPEARAQVERIAATLAAAFTAAVGPDLPAQ